MEGWGGGMGDEGCWMVDGGWWMGDGGEEMGCRDGGSVCDENMR